MRTLVRAVFGLVLRVFFRRIEVSGSAHVPARGPVMFVLNHPNGLVDPAFLLCLAPRRVSFLAKAPLFRMPVIGFFCRAFDAIPVSRRQDAGFDPAQNRQTFGVARAVLASGGATGAVLALPGRIERALSEVTLQAEQVEAHALVERAERILSVSDEAPGARPSLVAEFDVRRRLLAGYEVVRTQWPDRFAALATRI